jgi:murein DD-endopeptidase MepM/ murein hydrolase activator NlpD
MRVRFAFEHKKLKIMLLVVGPLLWIFAAPTIQARSDAIHCSDGIELRLNSAEYGQGSLALVSLTSPKPLGEVRGEWNGRHFSFWRADSVKGSEPSVKGRQSKKGAESDPATSGAEDERLALIGVDLEQAPGDYDLVVNVNQSDGEERSCTESIKVTTGHFATESLHVKPQFVEPNPEQLARAKDESKRLREIFDTATADRLWHGRFRIPLAGAKSGTNFGKRRILNGQPGSPHGGLDMPAPTGAPVFASQSGRVVLAQDLYFSGNTVIVDHGLGVYTFYGHFSEIDVKVGDTVNTQTVLGKVGATGRVTGPHLHWGLTVNRARVNPLQIVRIF